MTTCLYDDSPFLVDEILQQNHLWLEILLSSSGCRGKQTSLVLKLDFIKLIKALNPVGFANKARTCNFSLSLSTFADLINNQYDFVAKSFLALPKLFPPLSRISAACGSAWEEPLGSWNRELKNEQQLGL